MISARKQEKVPPADEDQNLTEKKNLSAPSTRQKSGKTLTFPKGSINTSFNADTQSRLQRFMLPGVCVIMTGLDLVWTRLGDLLPMVRLKNGVFYLRLLCLHASMLERPLGQAQC